MAQRINRVLSSALGLQNADSSSTSSLAVSAGGIATVSAAAKRSHPSCPARRHCCGGAAAHRFLSERRSTDLDHPASPACLRRHRGDRRRHDPARWPSLSACRLRHSRNRNECTVRARARARCSGDAQTYRTAPQRRPCPDADTLRLPVRNRRLDRMQLRPAMRPTDGAGP
jgi:hypothetical protein